MKRASLSPGKGGEAVGGAYDFSRDFYAGGEPAGGGAGELSDDDEL